MEWKIKIPVRQLVEYVFRSGSIQSGFRTASTLSEGTRAHLKVQKAYGENDESEVFLQTELIYENLCFVIEGRCDGLLRIGDEITVDEIKSTSGNIVAITEDSHPVHWAQAKCYAFMYAKQHGLSKMNVQLTYVQKDTEEKKQFMREFSFDELKDFMYEVIKGYMPFAKWAQEHKLARNSSIKNLGFPYTEYRKGQRQLAVSVYKTILENKTLFASAPTGIGKTISTLFPSVKAIGEGVIEKLFYLTAKTTTRQTAEEAFQLMDHNGLIMKIVTITAKDKVCFTDEGICDKAHCPFAEGHYDRINDAVIDILANETAMGQEIIADYANKHRVCPFEYSLELAYIADAVICDYNYIFDPRVSLQRMFADQRKQTILLVDEAHNLVSRAREMYSASLNKAMFLDLQREFKNKNRKISEAAKLLNHFFIKFKKQAGEEKFLVFKEVPEEMNALAERFVSEAEIELIQGTEGDSGEFLLDAYFAVLGWTRIAKLYDERYVTYIEIDRNHVEMKMFCQDPSLLVQQAGKSFKARIYFSATLSPIDYYMGMLGGDKKDYAISIQSPFTIEQTDVWIRPLSTRYRDREKSILPIVKIIEDAVKTRTGNYLIFFPSYQYMNRVYEEWTSKDGLLTIIQSPGMEEAEREAFLGQFQQDVTVPVVGFAVLGGIFSEGVDLIGDRLSGVIIVGVGLPQMSNESELIKKHFSASGKNGYDYAYVFPGMNKVLQAGGRLIRSETDTGRIVLIDDRFLQPKYQKMLPREWKDFQILR